MSAMKSPEKTNRSAKRTPAILASLVAASTLLGCGGSEPPAKSADDEEGERAFRREADEGDFGVSSDVGGMNEEKVKSAFKRARKGLISCVEDGWSRIEFLGGGVNFLVGVNEDGKVKYAYLERSTLGDRQTERCMLDVLREQKWPKAVGGEVGQARNSLEFDPPPDVRPPIDWSIDDISSGLGDIQESLDRCKSNASAGYYSVTMYVGTDGSAIAVGGSPPGPGADMALDCIVGALRSAKFRSPGSWPAKVTFDL